MRTTGATLILVSVVTHLLSDLVRSFAVAFLVITLLMVILFRDWKLGLIAMVPNILPVVRILGLMSVTGIAIDLSNVLIASIVLGLSVDDTIHLFHQFRRHHDEHGDCDAAITHALDHAGRAMVMTSVIIISAGFLTYAAASISNVVVFGSLIAAAAALALAADLLVAPSLLRIFYRRGQV